jgi:predicted ArsR family transcriptional regulator
MSSHSKSIEELSAETGLAPMTVRHHLEVLLKVGLAEEDETRVPHGVGRPQVRYKTVDKSVSITFPKRNYLYLSEFLIQGIIARLGEEKAKEMFIEIGRQAGMSLVKTAEQKADIKEWTADAVAQHLIRGIFEEFGIEPELIAKSASEVNFVEHNCLFRELAIKYPQVVCDGLDDGFHKGIDAALGPNVSTKKLKCAGHGDPYCQYAICWPKQVSSKR